MDWTLQKLFYHQDKDLFPWQPNPEFWQVDNTGQYTSHEQNYLDINTFFVILSLYTTMGMKWSNQYATEVQRV